VDDEKVFAFFQQILMEIVVKIVGKGLFVEGADGKDVSFFIDNEDVMVFVEDLVRAFAIVFHGLIIALSVSLFLRKKR